MNPPDDDLGAALTRHDIEQPAARVARLERYCALLWEWNAKLNLTRHTDYEKFVARDLVDSLMLGRFISSGQRVLDVGSGGGGVGVPLAVVRDELNVSLCESVGKKARALEDIIERLGLSATVFHARAENLLAERRFDVLVVRAVARLRKLLQWFRPHWGAFERILAVKGPAWVEERGEARHYGLLRGYSLRKLAEYPLPGTDARSVILQIRRKS